MQWIPNLFPCLCADSGCFRLRLCLKAFTRKLALLPGLTHISKRRGCVVQDRILLAASVAIKPLLQPVSHLPSVAVLVHRLKCYTEICQCWADFSLQIPSAPFWDCSKDDREGFAINWPLSQTRPTISRVSDWFLNVSDHDFTKVVPLCGTSCCCLCLLRCHGCHSLAAQTSVRFSPQTRLDLTIFTSLTVHDLSLYPKLFFILPHSNVLPFATKNAQAGRQHPLTKSI